jgi:methyl-accepting chemotaxis protein
MSNSTLERLRSQFAGPFIALVWAMAVVATTVAFILDRTPYLVAALALAGAAVATLAWRASPTGEVTRWTTSIALLAQVALLVLAAEGSHLQADMHMAFFAALAAAAGWCCPLTLVLGTIFVAVHHLALNFVYPAAVFPEGAEFGRVVLHAAILLVEAAALIVLGRSLVSAFTTVDEDASRIQKEIAAKHAAEAGELSANSRLEASRRETEERIVSTVGAIVAAAKAGDFSFRPEPDGDLGRLGSLVSGLNEVTASVDSATTEFLRVLNGMSEGDLTRQIATPYPGRFGELRDAVNDSIDRLSDTVSTIQSTSQDVAASARQITAGADDLSRRTEEQASSLEETAATTEELAASVKASAASSRQAVDLAEQAMRVAQDGGSIVTDAVEAMTRIEQASSKITDITSVIDDIAFQTNLLALNAAVEAARAGEAGKGFAVVASEVRTLAQRSSDAAKDISGLISTSSAEVAQGVRLVRSAGEALGKIVDASQRVASTVSEISTATAEQANGIGEMSQAVAHMDEMTQQNAALAEESAASAGAMASQIQRLNDLVVAFRTRHGAPSGHGLAAPPRVTSEPDRLRKLAAEAFSGRDARPKPAAAKAPPRPPRAANPVAAPTGRAQSGGWEEF